MDELPPPRSGQFLEISFRKLLKTCWNIVDGDNKGRKELTAWRSSPVFHHYVETLSEQLEALESSTTDRLDEDVMQLYKQQVAQLSRQLRPFGSTPTPAQDVTQLREARTALFSRLQPDSATSSQAAAAAEPSAPLNGAARRKLQTQEQLQEMLTDELLGMAAGMKNNTLAMEGQLRQRATLLDDTDAALQHSLQQARKGHQRAKEIHRRNRIGFCKTCMALLLVGCVFTSMYLYIRVTYMVGFRQ